MSAVKESYSSKELAEILQVSRQAVEKRAGRDCWESEKCAGKRQYPLATLPEDVRAAVALAQVKAMEVEEQGSPSMSSLHYQNEKR